MPNSILLPYNWGSAFVDPHKLLITPGMQLNSQSLGPTYTLPSFDDLRKLNEEYQRMVDEQTRNTTNQMFSNISQLGSTLNLYGSQMMNMGASLGNINLLKAGYMTNAFGNAASKMNNFQSTKGLTGDALSSARTNNLQNGISMGGDVLDGADKAFFSNVLAKQSGFTQGLDAGYDQAANMAPGWIGGAMKAAGFATDAARSAGLGTDLVTNADKVLDSKFLALTPVGLVNSLGKKKSKNFQVDLNMQTALGSDYSYDFLNKTAQNAGKSYGLFSRRKLRQLNNNTNLAQEMQNTMQDIADDAADARDMVNNTHQLNWLQYAQSLNGGLGNYAFSAKDGAKLQRIKKFINVSAKVDDTWKPAIEEYKEGGQFTWKFQEGGNIPTTRDAFAEYVKKQKGINWVHRLLEPTLRSIPSWEDPENSISSHRLGYGEVDGKVIIFPLIQELNGELFDFTNPDNNYTEDLMWDAAMQSALRNNDYVEAPNEEIADWFTNDNYKKYFETTKKYAPQNKNGGTIEWQPVIVFKEGGTLEETEEPISELQNVIPDGALHKNKHHMDNAEGLTKKGIPVIDNDGEQLAEIELNEIIFSLEVTKKLEDLYKSYSHDDASNAEKDKLAIEAGKLLVFEILHNTQDNTGLLNTIEE